MKKRSAPPQAGHSSEFKGVVKKIAGKLTSNTRLETEGREEMLGRRSDASQQGKGRRRLNPDPHRRG